MDTTGHLYGTTFFGGTYLDPNAAKGTPKGLGTAFELTPPSPSAGNWNESVLWSFGKGLDGYGSLDGLIIDSRGSLYGTTSQGGDPKGTSSGAGAVFGIQVVLTRVAYQAELRQCSRTRNQPAENNETDQPRHAGGADRQRDRDRAVRDCRRREHLLRQHHRPRKTCTFAVEFAPSSVGKEIGGIDVTYNGTSPSLVLEGNGVAPR